MAQTGAMERDDLLVAAQFTLFGVLALPGRARWRVPKAARAFALAALAGGGALAVAGVHSHGRTITPRVAPPSNADLLTTGPYRWSRHPIYGGLVLAAAGLAVLRARPLQWVALTALAGVLWVKTGREEVRLLARFGGPYAEYRARTPRLIGVPRPG